MGRLNYAIEIITLKETEVFTTTSWFNWKKKGIGLPTVINTNKRIRRYYKNKEDAEKDFIYLSRNCYHGGNAKKAKYLSVTFINPLDKIVWC